MQQHDSLADGYRLVAIEPMSGSTDCFNNADGLVVLQAGEVPPPPFKTPLFIRLLVHGSSAMCRGSCESAQTDSPSTPLICKPQPPVCPPREETDPLSLESWWRDGLCECVHSHSVYTLECVHTGRTKCTQCVAPPQEWAGSFGVRLE